MNIHTLSTCRQGNSSLARASVHCLRSHAPCLAWLLLSLLGLPPAACAQFECATNSGKVTITGYNGSGGDVEIPEALFNMSVVGIGKGAFQNCTILTSISIPRTVTKIGDNPFGGCTNLESITVDGLNTSFSSSGGLLLNKSQTTLIQCPGGVSGSFAVPGSVTIITNYAFYECVQITDVTIPSGVAGIGDYAFDGCSDLASLTISDTVAKIGQGAFYGCASLDGITIPNSVTSIGAGAFTDCTSLSSLAIPNSVTAIASQVFSGCTNLGKITIPNRVTSIGTYAFQNCSSLTNATIPSSVTSIGDYAFSGCVSLFTVSIPSQMTKVGNYVFSGCSNLRSVTIPALVSSIGDYAFADCTSLSSLMLPAKVASVGDYAFSGCASLTSFSATNSLTTMGTGAFANCSSLYQIRMPDRLTSIADRTFSGCTNLTNVVLKTRIKSIGDYAFSSCIRLAGITIPTSVKSIGTDTFYGCTGLLSITIPSGVKTLGDEALLGCVSLQSATLKSVSAIGNSVFSGCYSLTNVVIPGSAVSIGGSAFSGCSSLASLSLTGNIKTIGNYAFAECAGLRIAKLGGAITSIGDYAFADCIGLTNVTLPTKITSTGNYTFLGCTNLTSITIPSKVTLIGDFAFAGCTRLNNVVLPSTLTSIGTEAFEGCGNLYAITLPARISTIAYEAFANCPSLTAVMFLGNAPASVDADAFDGSSNVTIYYYYKTTGWSSTLSGRPATSVSVPIIVQGPDSQSAALGGKATFSVNAFGPFTLKYQWQFNGTNISGARSSSYALKSIQAKNAGNYQVIVANTYGSVTSSPAQLTFLSAAAQTAKRAAALAVGGFTTSPAIFQAVGTYKGLITPLAPFDGKNTGAFTLVVSSDGSFSAKLNFVSETVPASGRLETRSEDADNATARFTIQLDGRAVEFAIQVALDASTTVSGSMTVPGTTDRLAQLDGAMLDNRDTSSLLRLFAFTANTATRESLGSGYLSLFESGVILNLTLADKSATVNALATDRLKDGRIPLFSRLYSKRGFLQGWLTLSGAQTIAPSTLIWHKDPGASDTAFPQGFDLSVSITGPTVQRDSAQSP